MLKSETTDSAPLRAHYAVSGQEKVLRALQRDSQRGQQEPLQDVYKIPITEVPAAYSMEPDAIWGG